MRLLCFIITLCFFVSCEGQKKSKNKALEERISRIENGLQSNLQIHYKDSIIRSIYNIEERMQELKIPGLSIAVLHNGAIEWAKGYGIADSTENRKVTTETLFQAGSISKPIAATRALQLAENGLIDLDQNINKYLSSWKLPDNEFTVNEKVTTRRLLNHTAGINIGGFLGYKRGDAIPSTLEILDGKGNTDSIRVFRKPGEAWSYSGGGYTIMQQMVSDIDQIKFSETMRQNVLKTLGMKYSTYVNPLPEAFHSKAATGYNFDGTQVDGKWWVFPEMAAAGLWTTPSELILWAKEIQHILLTQNDGLLKAKTVNEMLTPNDDDQGLGPYVLDHIFGHGGAAEGFRADLTIWKDTANAAVIMVNSQNGNTIIREIVMSIAEEYSLPGHTPRKRVFKKQSRQELERFIGKYDFGKEGQSEIKIKDDGLELSGGLVSNPVFLWPESDGKFFSRETGLYFNFDIQETDVVSIKVLSYEGKKLKK
ncbi:serine hydrolase [uncultured Winogradskyella sp.]|uniref:serine hydrolase domain-containing protein n=1 Tax=uncultured Winogradskyella sp. TaxID=395353 RepID=UPI0026213B87|nr:serine hydrolase domain-containing protein [uncultured Winogradskyella sp.]